MLQELRIYKIYNSNVARYVIFFFIKHSQLLKVYECLLYVLRLLKITEEPGFRTIHRPLNFFFLSRKRQRVAFITMLRPELSVKIILSVVILVGDEFNSQQRVMRAMCCFFCERWSLSVTIF